MTFFEKIAIYDNRLKYIEHIEKHHKPEFVEEAKQYVLSPECEDDCRRLQAGEYFLGIPVQFRKQTGSKMRDIQFYSGKEKYLLSLIRYGLHDYNSVLSTDVYSHILGRSGYKVFNRICTTPGISEMYCFRTDVKDYDHSIDGDILKDLLKKVVGSDETLYNFLCRYLDDRRYYEDEKLCFGEYAVVLGMPLSGFFENFYLYELDHVMVEAADVYCRYNDDMIIYASSKEKLMECKKLLEEQLAKLKLKVNEEKTEFADPGEFIFFLDTFIAGNRRKPYGVVNYILKIHAITRQMLKVRKKFNLSPEAAISFTLKRIYMVLNKLYFELPYLTEVDILRLIDHEVQDALRIVGSGRRDKKRFNIRYWTLNELGYRSLVNRYYELRNPKVHG